MFISSKFHERCCPVISDFIKVTKESFTKPQLLQMETRVLIAVDFSLNYTLPTQLLESYIRTLALKYLPEEDKK